MLLILYAVLALVPLLGIVWVVMQGTITTVDGLFMSLIFLTISGIFAATALFELRTRLGGGAKVDKSKPATGASRTVIDGNSSSAYVEKGRVESVQFFEASVGQPNKSIVTLSNGTNSSRWLVFEGDLRNALPVGKRVEITSRDDAGRKILLDVQYR
jgi:hypothetical protein